jgi:hypothetical protein
MSRPLTMKARHQALMERLFVGGAEVIDSAFVDELIEVSKALCPELDNPPLQRRKYLLDCMRENSCGEWVIWDPL